MRRLSIVELNQLGGGIILTTFFIALYTAWLVVRPGNESLVLRGGNLLGTLGPLLIGTLLLVKLPGKLRHARRLRSAGSRAADQREWAPILIGLGILSFTLGEAIWLVYEDLLRQPTPFPSWADVAYLAAYPCLLLGIVLLPAERRSIMSRGRLILDGVMVMTVATTVSWYFLLGPTIAAAETSIWVTLLSLAYPVGDLGLVVCLLLLFWSSAADRSRWSIVGPLSLGLVSIVVADSFFGFQELHGGYQSGQLITDLGWLAGYMLLGLGALAHQSAGGSASLAAQDISQSRAGTSNAWAILLPYSVLPVVGVLFVANWLWPSHQLADQGVVVGSFLLVSVVVTRQILALLENHRLHAATMAYALQLERLATTDPVTELRNHRALVSLLDQEIERAHRVQRPFAVLFLDLDHFKAVNDTYGHASGDTVLIEVAQLLRALLRSIDFSGRWGGEEFLVLLPETDRKGALHTAERIRVALAQHRFAAGAGTHVSASIGVAIFPDDATERDQLVAQADRAMYAAKQLGRNQVRCAADEVVTGAWAMGHSASSRENATLVGTVEALSVLVAARDRYTGEHTEEVAAIALRLAVAMGLPLSEAHMVGLAARLHDIEGGCARRHSDEAGAARLGRMGAHS